uniref:BESS domain-containing protein n=1 Tax=Romanomermis culicivorax TaxID=13658 RepID=A0A915JGF0_ROMCU
MIVIDYPDVQNVPMTTLEFCSTSGQIQQQHLNDNQKRRAVTSMNLDHVTLPPTAAATSAQSSAGYQYPTSKNAMSPVVAAHSKFAFHGEKMRDVETVNVQQRFSYDNINSSVTSPLYRRCAPLSDIQERCGSSQSSSSSTQAPAPNGRHNSNGGSCGCASPSATIGSTAAKFFHRPSFRHLPEVNVDTDEEDDESCPSGDSFMELRDNVRECLERDPSERNEDDILVLLDFMQHMPAFANLPVRIKRELCLKMVFAVVEKANTIIMRDGEQMDSW